METQRRSSMSRTAMEKGGASAELRAICVWTLEALALPPVRLPLEAPAAGHAHHPRPSPPPQGEIRKVFWENLNSLKGKTVTHTDSRGFPGARLPPGHPRVKSSD